MSVRITPSNLADVRWYAYQLLMKLGWVGLIATLLFLASGWMVYSSRLLIQQIKTQQHLVETLKAGLAVLPGAGASVSMPLRQNDFYGQFMSEDVLAHQLNGLISQAKVFGIQLPQGSYRLVENRMGRLSRYEVTLPLVTSYPKVRQFIAAVTEGNAGLILKEISISRESTQVGIVEVTVVFHLYLRGKVA